MERGSILLRRGGLLIVIALAVLWPMSGAAPAQAAAVEVVSSSPSNGEAIAASPAAITITFNQEIGSAASVVIACNSNPTAVTAPRVADDLRSLVVDVAATPLPRGTCQVRWQVQGIAEPGVNSGDFSFQIQADTVLTTTTVAPADPSATTVTTTAPATSDDGSASEPTDLGGPLGLARLFSMLAIAALFGSLVLITVAWPEGIEYILTIRFLRYAWLGGLAATVVMVVCMRAEATGESFSSSLSPTSWTDLTDTTPGLAALARVALIAAAGWVAIRPERAVDPATQLPALALPGLAVATMGFSRTGGDLELVGFAAGAVHAVAMAVWFGGLLLLARVVLAGPGEDDLVHAVRGFGRLSTPAMLLTVVTGGVQLWRLDSGHLFDTDHGQLMLLKVVPVLAMVFIGVATRQFAHSRLNRAEGMTAPLAARLRRAVGMEAVIGVLILAITSWMLSTTPGNIVASARTSDGFAFQQRFVDATETLDVKVSLNAGRVGRNEAMIEVAEPAEDISQITIRFDPPANSAANPILMTITELRGAGTAYLEPSIGLPIGATGVWNVTVEVVAASGTFRQSAVMSILPATDATSDETVPVVTDPAVTSPPTTAAPSSTSSTVAP